MRSILGMFKQYKSYIHGTRGYVNQIYQYSQIDIVVQDRLNDTVNEMIDFRMKSFITAHKSFDSANNLVGLNKTNVSHLNASIRSLLASSFLDTSSALYSERIRYENIGKYICSKNNYSLIILSA